jgi:hypothetical protein
MNKDVFWEIMGQPARRFSLLVRDETVTLMADSKYEKFADGDVIRLTDRWWMTESSGGPYQRYIPVADVQEVRVEPMDWASGESPQHGPSDRWDEINPAI